jgi:hypothetical protein
MFARDSSVALAFCSPQLLTGKLWGESSAAGSCISEVIPDIADSAMYASPAALRCQRIYTSHPLG